MNPIVRYQNGNYTVTIDTRNGTKIRENDLDFFEAAFPESMDIKITNRCNMNCPMCFIAGTKILMSDYTYKNIEDIKIGDEVIGFEETPSSKGAKRKVLKTKVLNTFIHVESELIETHTDSNNVIISTPNHPFLSEGTGKNHARLFNKIANIPIDNNLFEFNFPIDKINYDSLEYNLGYTVASWAGDGCYYKGTDKNGYDVYNCRFVTLDEEINDKVYEATSKFVNDFYRLDFKMSDSSKDKNRVRSSVRSNKKSSYDSIIKLEHDNIGTNMSKEYMCGFLAGFLDCEGHVDNQRSIIRLTNTNKVYIDEICRCLNCLDLEYVIEIKRPHNNKEYKECFNVRIKGIDSVSRFLWYTRPVCKRKSFENYIKENSQYHKHKIIEKNIINKKQYVYNFETESHTYIANNFLVHNCHEDSTYNGAHGDIMSESFIDRLHPYTELALGGGNVLEHPDLISFLEKCKRLNLIPNMTVNQTHFMENLDLITELVNYKLIYGLGISLTNPTEEFISAVKKFPNAVIHVINGIHPVGQLERLKDHNLKILILGYKEFRRGKRLYEDDIWKIIIEVNKNLLYAYLPEVIKEQWFDVVSFDNLAIKQLNPQRLMSREKWDEMYMGDDGVDGEMTSASMYVDMVKREFALNSCAIERYPLMDNIEDMFNFLRGK